jgi:hypothetical protein
VYWARQAVPGLAWGSGKEVAATDLYPPGQCTGLDRLYQAWGGGGGRRWPLRDLQHLP